MKFWTVFVLVLLLCLSCCAGLYWLTGWQWERSPELAGLAFLSIMFSLPVAATAASETIPLPRPTTPPPPP